MRKLFRPTHYQKNAYEIDYKHLEEKGIKLLCYDLDNTLDYPDNMTTEILPETVDLFKELEKYNFQILIVSNNTLKNRVKLFADLADKPYIEAMAKPFMRKYKSSSIITGYNKDEVVFIGDKIITDIFGANRYGSSSILVDPLIKKQKSFHQKGLSLIDDVFCKIIGFNKGEYY